MGCVPLSMWSNERIFIIIFVTFGWSLAHLRLSTNKLSESDHAKSSGRDLLVVT